MLLYSTAFCLICTRWKHKKQNQILSSQNDLFPNSLPNLLVNIYIAYVLSTAHTSKNQDNDERVNNFRAMSRKKLSKSTKNLDLEKTHPHHCWEEDIIEDHEAKEIFFYIRSR